MNIDENIILGIIKPFANEAGGLMPALHALQNNFGFIDQQIVPVLADCFNQTRADIFGVISFYPDFKSEKPAKHQVKICQAEACQAVGSSELTTHAKSQKNDNVTIEPVYCLGNCACGPAMMVNNKLYGRVDRKRFDAIINNHQLDKA